MITRAWLQQDPSPSGGGAYHWHVARPGDGRGPLDLVPAHDRAGLAERLHGEAGATAIWRWDDAHLLWASVFTARAPHDGRSYRGLVVTRVDGTPSVAGALREVPTRVARPWSPLDEDDADDDDGANSEDDDATSEDDDGGDDDDDDGASRPTRTATALAALVLRPGPVAVVPACSPRLPRWLARVITRAEPIVVSPRPGFTTLVAGAARASGQAARILATAALGPTTAAASWRVLVDLAAARAAAVPDLEPELAAVAEAFRDAAGVAALVARVLTDDEVACLARAGVRPLGQLADAEAAWRRLLHYWGRGVFDAAPSARSLPTRLAEVIALRAALTPAWAGRLRAEIGWASLLPAVRRDHLHATLRARVPALALELDHG